MTLPSFSSMIIAFGDPSFFLMATGMTICPFDDTFAMVTINEQRVNRDMKVLPMPYGLRNDIALREDLRTYDHVAARFVQLLALTEYNAK
jgi:hypothetical protein